MGRHTPGPWRVDDRYVDGDNDVLDSERFKVADVPWSQLRIGRNGKKKYRELTTAEQIANARLIAAAPELLTALKALLAACNEDNPIKGLAAEEAARAAIAKAEGLAAAAQEHPNE